MYTGDAGGGVMDEVSGPVVSEDGIMKGPAESRLRADGGGGRGAAW